MIVSLAAALALSAATPAPAKGAVDALVDRCFAAYGGAAGHARSARSWIEGSVTSVVLHPGVTGRFVRVYERPGRLRVELDYPGAQSEVRVLDGSRGWRNGEAATGPRLEAMILQAARLDMPALLHASRARVKDGGTAEVAGKPVRLLAIEPGPGLVVEAAVDPATGRILRTRGASTGTAAGGMTLEFLTTYSDFEKIEGVLVPRREENWANGKSTGVTVLEKVAFPRSLPASAFKP